MPSVDRPTEAELIEELAHLFNDRWSAAHLLSDVGIDPTRFSEFGVPDIQTWWVSVNSRIMQGVSDPGAWRMLLKAAASKYPGNRLLQSASAAEGVSAVVSAQSVIFLSYANPDLALVDRLYDSLRAADDRIAVFQDHRAIRPGDDWLETIRTAAGRSSMLVTWVTPAFLVKPFCTYEIRIAEERDARIVPIWVDGIDPRSAPAYLSGRQGRSSAAPHDFAALADWLINAL